MYLSKSLYFRMAFAREWLEANECSGLIKDVLTSAGEDKEFGVSRPWSKRAH